MKRKKPTERPFVESYAEQAGLTKVKRSSAPRFYYLSGAVTNDPYAKLKFDLAEIYLKSRGHIVINPLKINPLGTKWEVAISNDLFIINQMKDVYIALLHLSKYMDEDKICYPTIADIDPHDRQFESQGKRLEKGIAFGVLPTVMLSQEWERMLFDAIARYEREVHDAEKR